MVADVVEADAADQAVNVHGGDMRIKLTALFSAYQYRIQYIQRRLPLPPEDKRNRCRKALADAMALGLPELEIRRMAKLAAWQVAPPEAIQQPASSNVQRKHGR